MLRRWRRTDDEIWPPHEGDGGGAEASGPDRPRSTAKAPRFGVTFGTAALVLALVLLLGSAVTLHVTGSQSEDSRAEVVRTETILRELGGLATRLGVAEAEQRGYLLTGDRTQLAAFQEASHRIRGDLDQLVRLVRHPAQVVRLAKLRPLIDAELASLAETAALRARSPEAALAAARADMGPELRALVAAIDVLTGAERDLLVERAAREGRLASRGTHAATLAGVLALFSAILGVVSLARHRTRAALTATSEMRLRLALDAGGMGTFFWDIPADRFEWDAVHCALFGAPGPTATLAGEEAIAFVHPEDRELVQRNLQLAQYTGQGFTAEFRIRRPDGEERWVAAYGTVVRDLSAQPAAMHGVNFDITERKQGEERQELLRRELNHRVRNILAVVQSVALLTGRKASSLDAFQSAFLGRLRALSAANELLMGNSWRATDLDAVIRRALRAHGSEGGEGRFTVNVMDNRSVDAVLAQDLMLALHELATNAAKYGALSVPQGRVVIEAGARQDVGGAILFLVWREEGGPPVEEPAAQGFGTLLLDKLLGPQHGGTVDMAWRREGLICRIEVRQADGV